MADVPAEAITAAVAALNEAHSRRGWNKPQPWWAEEVATAILEAAAGDVITEHAHQMSGGGFHVWNTDPEILKIYPLAEKIRHGRQHGGHVYRRRVIVVEDWEEITGAEPGPQ